MSRPQSSLPHVAHPAAFPELAVTLGLAPDRWRVLSLEGDQLVVAGTPVSAGHQETVTFQCFPWLSLAVPAVAHEAGGSHQTFTLQPSDPEMLALLHAVILPEPENQATTEVEEVIEELEAPWDAPARPAPWRYTRH